MACCLSYSPSAASFFVPLEPVEALEDCQQAQYFGQSVPYQVISRKKNGGQSPLNRSHGRRRPLAATGKAIRARLGRVCGGKVEKAELAGTLLRQWPNAHSSQNADWVQAASNSDADRERSWVP